MASSLGGNYGTNPFEAGYPQVRSYTCGATPSGTYSPVPQSSLKLKFDPTSGRYKLSWRTSKNISGCQEMLLGFTGVVGRTVQCASASTR